MPAPHGPAGPPPLDEVTVKARQALIRILERRFGPLPAPVMVRITGAPPRTLLRWTRRAPRASSLEDALRPPG